MNLETLKIIVDLVKGVSGDATALIITYFSLALIKYIIGFGVLFSFIILSYKIGKNAQESAMFSRSLRKIACPGRAHSHMDMEDKDIIVETLVAGVGVIKEQGREEKEKKHERRGDDIDV